MSNTDRLINHDDAEQIASLLEDIGEQNNQVLTIPTLSTNEIEYDGESHSVTEILVGYDPKRMILIGDLTTESSIGSYTVSIQLKYVGDTWSDKTTEIKTYSFDYIENE